MVKKRDGLNWFMIVVGVLVMVVIVVFGGRYILKGSEKVKRSFLDISVKDKVLLLYYQDFYEINLMYIYEIV